MARIPNEQAARRQAARRQAARPPAGPPVPAPAGPPDGPAGGAAAAATGSAVLTGAPTSTDVARLAGVSRATVSYVLNNTTTMRISEATRQRVLAAAEEIGYVPHAAARSLRAGHSRMVLMPAPNVPLGALYGGFLGDLQQALGRSEYTVVQYGGVGRTGDDAARAWAEFRPVAVLAPAGHGLGPWGVALLKRSGARAVLTLGPERVDGAHALLTDHRKVGRCAATHLLERGRTALGLIVPGERGLEAVSHAIAAGMRHALADSGVPGATLTEVPLDRTEEAAARLASRWRGLGLDGVFAHNDEYAMLLMRALQDEGVAVPAQTAVMGADDLLLGRLLRPRLSTVRISLPSAQTLAALVDRLVNTPGGQPEVHDLLRATAVRREST
ncbi:LacI family DNA-binding transcriptional regulator [Streptomyces odontomachi]|uniref:LacI family DNA-binding transcriptional regulator n=1 Tax=Streptomyces odontomachi TaxID=2944940 RepID=UPI00210B9930|nr:LacI family DNA-binding transcriptional regulator [Streptomyces sp. ODS25]